MLDVDYDEGVDYLTLPECLNDVHPDDHWFLKPLCHAPTLVGPHWRQRDDKPICGLPLGDYPHNEYGLRDHEEGIEDDTRMPWHEFVQPPDPLVWGDNAFRGNECPGYIDDSWREPEARPRKCMCECHWGSYHVNVYEVDREWGGAEEGGWWYDSGEPVATVPFDSLREAEAFAEVMRERFPYSGSSSSVAYKGGDFSVRIEREFARAYPEQRPRYE